ncbi:MAG: hypothetical protein MJ072_00195, partial [Clostridia bacterium]|nr:hypothetical protein [Clostridia bacterium]
MSRYYSFNEENASDKINDVLTNPLLSADISDADYTDINAFCDLYREAKVGFSGIIPDEGSNHLDEIVDEQTLKKFPANADKDEKTENLKNVRKGLKETYAKDVVVGGIVSAWGNKIGVENAEKYSTFFERGKFGAPEFNGAGDKFQKTVKFLTDPAVKPEDKAKRVSDHVEKLMKEYSGMSFPKTDGQFGKEYESLMDKASVMEGLSGIYDVSKDNGFQVDRQTLVKLNALYEFGKAYKKVMTGRAQKIADPLYPEIPYDNIPTYYKAVYGEDMDKSSFIDGD